MNPIPIPSRGNGRTLAEVLAGPVDAMCYPMIGMAARVASKPLKVIGITTQQRHADFPKVPTMAERASRASMTTSARSASWRRRARRRRW